MKRIVNSPLKIIGLLTTILGVLGVLTFSYFFFVGIYLLGIGILIYLIDYLTSRFLKNKRVFWTSQTVLTIAYLILAFLTYMEWQEHNYVVFPKEYKGQAGIIFGIEGYPELPKTEFWKKTINIPRNGIIITSTKVEEIPSRIQFAFTDKSIVDYNKINWDPNFEIDCIISDRKVKSWLFLIDSKETSNLKNKMTELCNEISANKLNSFYKKEFSAINSDNRGKLYYGTKEFVSL